MKNFLLFLLFFLLLNFLAYNLKKIIFFIEKNKYFKLYAIPNICFSLICNLFRTFRQFVLIEIFPLIKWGFFKIILGRGTHYNFDLLKDFRWRIKSKFTKVIIIFVIIWGFFIFFNFVRNFLVVWKDLYFFFHKKSVMFFFLFFLEHFNEILF